MTLSVPAYIESANIQDTTVRYKWDDWNVEQAEEPIDEDVFERLNRLSLRANVVLTIGTAEWIVERFRPLLDVQFPLQYLEAAWAQCVHFRYASCVWEDRAPKDEWTGPVKGPVGIAMTRVMYAVEQAEAQEYPSLRAAWISNLAQYLMHDPKPFQSWFESILKRFERLFPLQPENKLGAVIPREVLDPAYEFKADDTVKLIQNFLSGLDYEANPFLSHPEEMVKQGFGGKPYQFELD